MISFDKLPTSLAAQVYPEGTYKGEIVKAEMKSPKNDTRPDYLSIQWNLTSEGKKIGTFFDIFTEPNNQYTMFKLRKFLEATDINLREFELRDLAKLIPGKKCLITIGITKDNMGNDQNCVNLFGSNPPYERLPIPESPIQDEELPFTMGQPQPDVNADENY